MKVRELMKRLREVDPDMLVAVAWNHFDGLEGGGVSDAMHAEVLMVDDDGEVGGGREYAETPTLVIHGHTLAHADE